MKKGQAMKPDKLDEMAEVDELYDDIEEYQPLDLQADTSNLGSQWVTFTLGSEIYGIDILKVHELIGYTHITALPNMPSFFKGMLNLRGQVIPVIDLRLKFSMPPREYTKYTVIIVVRAGEKLMGLTCDSVSDVVFISEDRLQKVDEFSVSIDTKYIQKIGRLEDGLVVLLDIDFILTKSEFGKVLDNPAEILHEQEHQEDAAADETKG